MSAATTTPEQVNDATPSTPTGALYRKLIVAAASVSSVEKNGQNNQQNYEYAKAEDVIAAASKALVDADLAVLPTMGTVEIIREYETRSGSYGVTVRVEMLYTVADPETGETIERRYLGTGSDSPGDKAIYKAVTGAAKYFYAGLLGIGFGADPENETGGEGSEPVAAAPAGKPVVRLNPQRTERIIGRLASLKLSFKEIALALGSCGIDGLRTNTAEAIQERISGLGEVEADALEAELERAAQDADATAPDLTALSEDRVDNLLKGFEIAGPEFGGLTPVDGLNVLLGSLGADGFDPTADLRPQFAALDEATADALDAEFQKAVESDDAEEVDGEVVGGGGDDE
jgi:hypothetical protein